MPSYTMAPRRSSSAKAATAAIVSDVRRRCIKCEIQRQSQTPCVVNALDWQAGMSFGEAMADVIENPLAATAATANATFRKFVMGSAP